MTRSNKTFTYDFCTTHHLLPTSSFSQPHSNKFVPLIQNLAGRCISVESKGCISSSAKTYIQLMDVFSGENYLLKSKGVQLVKPAGRNHFFSVSKSSVRLWYLDSRKVVPGIAKGYKFSFSWNMLDINGINSITVLPNSYHVLVHGYEILASKNGVGGLHDKHVWLDFEKKRKRVINKEEYKKLKASDTLSADGKFCWNLNDETSYPVIKLDFNSVNPKDCLNGDFKPECISSISFPGYREFCFDHVALFPNGIAFIKMVNSWVIYDVATQQIFYIGMHWADKVQLLPNEDYVMLSNDSNYVLLPTEKSEDLIKSELNKYLYPPDVVNVVGGYAAIPLNFWNSIREKGPSKVGFYDEQGDRMPDFKV